MTDDLADLLRRASERVNAMTPAEHAEMVRAQRRSYVIAEAGFGDDKDEADCATALNKGDKGECERLERAAAERMRNARNWLNQEGY